MTDIKRYRPRLTQGSWPCFDAAADMAENINGCWVSYEDHAALVEKMVEAAKAAWEVGYATGKAVRSE